ncbi:MAG: DNA polymerase III subunit alpha [Chitinophagales bacterium]|jgi:DNA polymerase-3 subunit alpha|nr:DNA polymerase III subunit alpha [Sphingobacteriales bacterium]MBP9142762.1 DNA polymerase III subunit alpha [Chitinophagales bacterium]MDA0199247.1 DNA polymerase III subunit alpha [Bacteroidota bacterium]MBK8677155.1 DNA polymerase III subunit alpha [Sphingobacteriales bacterium]MBL0248215.1 DNA polymerase III subunit alpha [Sphingobacteriales bacterium]
MPDFCHLHCHSQYSLLDGAADITKMVQKAQNDGHAAVAITDHGNMFGAFEFYKAAKKIGIKPIMGCEVYLVENRHEREFTKGRKDKRFHQLLLAKNELGYYNLSKLVSLGFIEGFYHNFPRIDLELLRQYSEGLIATTCCVGAKVPQTIIHQGEAAAEKVFCEFLEIFGEDYYVELQRHNLPDIDNTGWSQEAINQVLLKFAHKHNVKIIATNDSHYTERADAEAHDILLCLQTGAKINDQGRFKFPNNEFYFKSYNEMLTIFKDLPEAVHNTAEIAAKIEAPKLVRDVLMPNFSLPPGFNSQDDYLAHLCFDGAQKRYGSNLSSEITDRLNFELSVIKEMRFPGYFLIVQDFIAETKKMGVAVGPGRGSAAGSIVAYCIGITNIDPIKYKLLFERFLNPERVSMPDIDIDFDDEGRQSAIEYVINKYGKNHVAQIQTYGTMGARSAIRDVGRVLEVPLTDTDKLAKMFPDGYKNLEQAFKDVQEYKDYLSIPNSPFARTLKMAQNLEGAIRNRGIHAAGIIIAPTDITECVPVCTAKDADLLVTQFEGKYIEEAGMLKMDFLGLKTLTIIKDAIYNIHKRYTNKEIAEKTPGILSGNGEEARIDPDLISEQLNDQPTYDIFRRGETIGIFQFESDGMQKHLKQLNPSGIEDLIAMNALYRPGPLDFIPEYIERRHGRKKVVYPHPWLEPVLKNTYGIMVYQEQIMQAGQIMAGYSLGQADVLRRVMGKKQSEEMVLQRKIFEEGVVAKGVSKEEAKEIFDTMERFAQYGFNRSHAVAYSVVAFQTAYLKANYPAEFMAANVSHYLNDLKQVNFYLNECNRMGIAVKTPDINESESKFTVNKKGQIRFALNAIKGVGAAAVQEIIAERNRNGHFKDVFNFVQRVNLRTVNKKTLEGLVFSGCFDGFTNIHRAQYFYQAKPDQPSFIEKLLKYGANFQEAAQNSQQSLFGDSTANNIVEPPIPDCEPWSQLVQLNHEREITGIYLSGHPLDRYKMEIDRFCTCTLEQLPAQLNLRVTVAGLVTSAQHKTAKTGNPYGRFVIEDYSGSYELNLWSEDYAKYRHWFDVGQIVYVEGNYQKKWRDSDDYDLKVSNIGLLSTLKEKIKRVIVQIDTALITEAYLNSLEAIFTKHQGSLPLYITLVQNNQQPALSVDLRSREVLLANSPQLFADLDTIDGLSYKIG